MRIFKSEVTEMKQDGKSAASSDTVKGETIKEEPRTAQPEGTSPIREDNSPKTDNQSGPVS
jgi:sec-independent protein translocase protein TatA